MNNKHSIDQNSPQTLYQNRDSRLLREKSGFGFLTWSEAISFPLETMELFLAGTFCRNPELEQTLTHGKFQHPGAVSGTLITLWPVIRTYRAQQPVSDTV